jgi:ferredoxin-type protein NapG
MGITRRDFIVAGVSAAALAACGSTAAYAGVGTSSLVRPVGGQDEAAFLAGCLRCDRCRSVCPENVIDLAHVEEGFFEMRTPKMNFHLGACTFCNKCVEVCPTGVLHPIDPADDKLGIAEIKPAQCVAYRNPGSCSKCADVCPYDACHIQGGYPVIDDGACNGCGTCVRDCPALVLTAVDSTGERGVEVVTVAQHERG